MRGSPASREQSGPGNPRSSGGSREQSTNSQGRGSPARGAASPSSAQRSQRGSPSPKQSTPHKQLSNGRDCDGAPIHNDGAPTQQELDAMNLPFKEKPASKRDRNLSISRSGRHKYKNKQRMSVLQQDIYSDIPADLERSPGSSGSGLSPSGGGYHGAEPHSHHLKPHSHTRPTLAISGASAAV